MVVGWRAGERDNGVMGTPLVVGLAVPGDTELNLPVSGGTALQAES